MPYLAGFVMQASICCFCMKRNVFSFDICSVFVFARGMRHLTEIIHSPCHKDEIGDLHPIPSTLWSPSSQVL